MLAIKKIDELGMKRIHTRAAELRPSLALETVYRWRQALRTPRGVADDIKRLLMEATADTPHALTWADFEHGGPQS